MELIFTEKIKLSEKERKAFDTVHNCCLSIMRECRNHENHDAAENICSAINDFYEYVEIIEEEPTKEHSWDERHIPSQFELNP